MHAVHHTVAGLEIDSKAGLDEEMLHTVSQSLLLLWWCLVLWAEMVWLSHVCTCRVVVLQFFSAKGQVSNFLRVVNSAFSTVLKWVVRKQRQRRVGYHSALFRVETWRCPFLGRAETKHWKKALSIRKQKRKDEHPGWQTQCLRGRK